MNKLTTGLSNITVRVDKTDVYTYFGGFERTVQERVEAEDSNTFAVKDTKYNSVGLVEKESLPYFGVGAADTDATATSTLYINYQYDPLHRVTSIENAVGETTNTYEDWRIITTDPNGEIKRLSKDAHGNLVEVEEINGGSSYTTLYEYDGNKNLKKITDALGNIRNFTYDALGRQLTAEDLHASGDGTFGTWTYTYDDSGNKLSQVDPKAQTVNFTYDDLNRVLTENYTGAGGTEITYGYDSCFGGKGMLCAVTNFYANFAYEYFPMGLVKKETKNISSVAYPTSYTYDRLGNIATITHPDEAVIGYVYNTAGQPEKVWWKEDYASASTTVVTDLDYAPTGQISYQKNGNGVETTNTYDATEGYRLINKKTLGPSNSNTTRFYSGVGDGKVAYVSTTTSSWAIVHNAPTGTIACNACSSSVEYARSFEGPGITNYYGISRGFFPFNTSSIPSDSNVTSAVLGIYTDSSFFLNLDNDGNDFVSVVENSQASSTRLDSTDYDALGTLEGASRIDFGDLSFDTYNSFTLNSTGRSWIKKAGEPSNCGNISGWTCFGTREGHDLLDSPVTTDTGNAVVGNYSETFGTTTDPYLEVTYNIPGTVLQNISYTYDDVGNITTLAESATTSARRTVAYQYDDLHRLTRASSTLAASNYLETYTYSAVGNITNKSDQGSYTYAGNTGSNYANPHAATVIGSSNLTYDNNGNLLTFGPQSNVWDYRNRLTQTSSGTATSTNTYDYTGERVKYTNNSGTTTTYVSKFYDIKDSVVKKHVYIGDNLALTIQATPNEVGNSTTPPDEGESLASGGIGGSVYTYTLHYVHGDHLSGSNVITDDNGNLEETLDYLPFGKVRVDDSVTGYSQNQKYIGEMYDSESELSYLNARFQNGKTGTFLSQDPMFWGLPIEYLIDPQQQNSYAYARNNPINRSDPTGLLSAEGVVRSLIQKTFNLANSVRGVVEKVVYNPSKTASGALQAGKKAVSDPVGTAGKILSSAATETIQSATQSIEDITSGDENRQNDGLASGLILMASFMTPEAKPLLSTGKIILTDTVVAGSRSALSADAVSALSRYEANGWQKLSDRATPVVHQNREGFLPTKGPGYYTEYYAGPRSSAERFVRGGNGELYYTNTHYGQNGRLPAFINIP